MSDEAGNPSTSVIRRLTPADAPAYRPLRLEALRLHPEAFSSDYQTELKLEPAAVAARMPGPPGGLFGGFVRNGSHERLAGMAGLVVDPRPKLRHKGLLVGMYVAAPYRRHGLARALVQCVIEQARAANLHVLHLGVTCGNEPARQLYLQLGFRSYGVERDALCVEHRFYDEELMALRLA